MTSRDFIATACASFLVLAACSEKPTAPEPVAAAPAPAAANAPTTPASGLAIVTGPLVQLADGLITLQIPAGWSIISNSDQVFEIETDRHKGDTSKWARCRTMIAGASNTSGKTQEEANKEFAAEPSDALNEIEARGDLIEHSTSTLVGDVQVVTTKFKENGAYNEIRQLTVVHSVFMIAVHLDCNATQPVGAEDTSDMNAFLDSIKINRS
jgi:hypothetical protein